MELPARIYTAPFFSYAGGVLMADDLLFLGKPVSAVFSVPFLSKRLAVGQRATMRVIGEIAVSGGAAKMARLAMECEAELSLPDELPALEPGQLLTAATPLLSTHYHEFSALAKALGGGGIVLLQGPPGTGKTTVIVEIIRQLVSRGECVLVSAQARAAVENIYNKLKSLNDGVGSEQGQVLRVAYNRNEADWQVSTSKGYMLFLLGDNVELLGMLRVGSKEGPLSEEEAELLCSVRSYDKKSEMPRLHKRVARQYASNAAGLEVRKVQKVLERLAEQLSCVEIPPDRFAKELCMANIQVVCGTCVGLGVDTEIKRMTFDTVIIDEAGKANYAELATVYKMLSREQRATTEMSVKQQFLLNPPPKGYHFEGCRVDKSKRTKGECRHVVLRYNGKPMPVYAGRDMSYMGDSEFSLTYMGLSEKGNILFDSGSFPPNPSKRG